MIFNTEISAELKARLRRHNMCWQRRLEVWHRYVQAPWWGHGLVISPELRGRYEAFLPIAEYLASLNSIARYYLPDNDWLPFPLRHPFHASLPDFWADLPPHLAGTPLLSEEGLLPLLCALADPSSFGTIKGRYSRQLHQLEAIATPAISICDIACGVGLNTIEIAESLARFSPKVLGITSEHLEVWMARSRHLPHDLIRQRLFSDVPVSFEYGHAETFSAKADIITCNGLIGGRFFNTRPQYLAFLECCRKAGAHHIFAANHFHDGRYAAVSDFISIARQSGWSAQGTWHNLTLKKQ